MGSYLIKDFIFSYSNYFFILVYRSSFFFLIRCNDWFIMWLSLEINIFRFLLIIRDKISNRIESRIKYFFIQRLGSRLLILSFYSQRDFEEIINILVIRYKIGAGPFYFWFPSVCEIISWGSCLLLIRIQKFIPLVLISIYSSGIIWVVVISRIVVGVVGIINQIRIKRLLAFSSIHHIGWILICNFIYDIVWLIYLAIYTFIILRLIVIILKYEGINFNLLGKVYEKYIFILRLLSIGGIPPILGFFLKWWVFYYIKDLDFFLIIFIIIMSVRILYYYMRIVFFILYGEISLFSWGKLEDKNIIFLSYEIFFLIGTLLGPVIGLMFIIYLNKIIILLIFKVKSVYLIWIYSSSSNDF